MAADSFKPRVLAKHLQDEPVHTRVERVVKHKCQKRPAAAVSFRPWLKGASKVSCKCGGSYTLKNKAAHCKSWWASCSCDDVFGRCTKDDQLDSMVCCLSSSGAMWRCEYKPLFDRIQVLRWNQHWKIHIFNTPKLRLGGVFKLFLFSSLLGEMIQFD